MITKKKAGRPKKEQAEFVITITQDKETIKASGSTVLEALKSIVKPLKIVGKVFLKITDGKRTAETMYMPVRAKRLFYPNAQVVQAKQLEYLMK